MNRRIDSRAAHDFRAAVGHYTGPLAQVASYMDGSRESSIEALVEDAVTAAYRNLERKPEAMSDKFWLFKNLVAVLDRHREAGRIVEYAAVERTPARPLVTEEGLPDPAAVAELVENGSIAEDTMRVRDAVRSLSYPARLAFVLSQIGNFTYRQTASLTGLTFDDVRDYLHRARRRIRDELLESCPV